MSKLKHVVIVFEPETACRDHLARHGYPDHLASEIATYLAQATDLEDFEEEIRGALAAEGLGVTFTTLAEAPEALLRADPEHTIVWCQTDGVRFYRGSSIPALARLLGLARYGSPPAAQHLCQDKFGSLALAAGAGLPIPPTRLLEGATTMAALRESDLDWDSATLFVKPATLGAKLGIFADSRCVGMEAAARLGQRIWDRYADRAIVQAYIAGDDIRVSYMDTGKRFESQVGVGRLRKNSASETSGAFMTMQDNETLSGAGDTQGSRNRFGRAHDAAFTPEMDDLRTTDDSRGKAAACLVMVYADRLRRLISLQDYFSMDFRLDAEGRPIFFEFEVCPAVTIYDFQHYLANTHGLNLGPALARSLLIAFERYRSQAEA
ncbi:MAG: hypothetical protein PGN25_11560 [Methylorubrum populi]